MANWLESMYPQSMAGGLTEQDREMLKMRMLMGAGTGMLSGASAGKGRGYSMAQGAAGGMDSMDSMMNSMLKQKMQMNNERMANERMQISRDVNERAQKEYERKMTKSGLLPTVENVGGIPHRIWRTKEGKLIDSEPVAPQWAFGMPGIDGAPGGTPPVPPAEEPGALNKFGSWLATMTGAGSGGSGGGAPAPHTYNPNRQTQGLMDMLMPTPRGGPAQQQRTTNYSAQPKSNLPAGFANMPPEVQKIWAKASQHTLTEDDKKYLVGLGVL